MKLEILKKEQAIADSLLAPYKDEQTGAAEIQAKKIATQKARQRRWIFSFFGSAIGYGIGFFFIGNAFQTALAGWVIGGGIAYLLRDRESE